MTGIVNSTAARSGIIGTTVGTPASGDNTPSFRATLSTNASVATDDYVILPFNVDSGGGGWDTDSAYDTSNYKFVVPSGEGGKYFFNMGVSILDPGNKKLVQLTFFIDGAVETTYRTGQFRYLTSADTSGSDLYFTTTTLLSLSATQEVSAYVYQNHGSLARTVYVAGSFFGGFKLAGV
tara:strand:- start:287 stop:823 length:537 start_codon:yes stop_codon:yes gene_type:complete